MSTILRLISNLARLGLKTLAFIIKNPIKSLMILLTTILGPLWPFAIPLRMIGFGAGGVVGGTAAAGIQSTVYGAYVPAGSLFALLQGVGALIGV